MSVRAVSSVCATYTVCMAYLMLVPRFTSVLGLLGGLLAFVSSTAVMFGIYKQVSV